MYDALDITGAALFLAVLVIGTIFQARSKVLDKKYFQQQWAKVQGNCANKKFWYQAIIEADELLDEALRRRHFKGKTTGERLVAAQHDFSSNDAVWLSHKLKNKITDTDYKKLSKKQTIEALAAFKVALTDLGALSVERKTKSSK